MNSAEKFTLILWVFYSTLFAQDSTTSVINYISDSVLVESSRYSMPINEAPYSIDFLDSKTIQNITNPISIEDILNSQAGIFLSNRNNISQGDKITIRGIGTRSQFGIRGIKIFLDGIPLTFTDGQSQLNNLDIDEIENIEILKGPSSVLFGNALGGIILITSKKYLNRDYLIKPKTTFGSYGFRKVSLSTDFNLNNNFHAKINMYSAKLDGFRDHSQSKYSGVNLISNFRVSERFNISMVSNYYYSPYLLNPSTLNKMDAESNPTKVRILVSKFGLGKKVDQLQGGIVLDYLFSSNSKVKSTFFFAARSLRNSIPASYIKLNRLFCGIRTEFNQKTTLFDKELGVLIGIDFENQYDIRKEYLNEGFDNIQNFEPSKLLSEIDYTEILINQSENVRSIGIFSFFQYKLAKRLFVFSGIRYDDYYFDVKNKLLSNYFNSQSNRRMSNISYMLGYNFKFQNNLNIYGNFSTGFQTPTTNELSNNPESLGGFNKKIKPEKAYNLEVGIKGWIERLNLYSAISVYYMNLYDMLVSYESPQEITFYRNIGEANNIGVDFQFEYYASEKLKFVSSYSLMRFKFFDYVINQTIDNEPKKIQLKNKYLPGVPNNRFSLRVQNYFYDSFYLGVNFNWVDQYFTNDYNGPIPGNDIEKNDFINNSYWKININSNFTIYYKYFSIKLYLAVNNIFNERYNGSIVPNAFGGNFFEPAPGRSYFASLEFIL